MVSLGNLGAALQTVRTGLSTSQQTLDVVANNVANVNTPGYTRKQAQLQQKVLGGVGVGVEIAALKRVVDENLLNSLRSESGVLGEAKITATFEARVQDLFGTPDANTSIAHRLSQFQAAVETLAAAPDGSIEQRDLVRWGEEVAATIRHMAASLQQLRSEADQRIGQAVGEINSLLEEVASLNDKIVRATYQGQDPNELADARDLALGRLSELIDVRTVSRDNGDVAIFTGGGRTLLNGDVVRLNFQQSAQIAALNTYDEGDLSGLFLGDASAGDASAGDDVTATITGGTLGGLIRLRDTTLTDMQRTVDELARSLRDQVNRVHNDGVAYPGASQMQGTRVFAAPSVQQITLTAGDVNVALLDANGNQTAAVMVGALMGGAGPFTVSALAADLQTWLQANGAPTAEAAVVGGRVVIDLHTTGVAMALGDQASTTPGDADSRHRSALMPTATAASTQPMPGFLPFSD